LEENIMRRSRLPLWAAFALFSTVLWVGAQTANVSGEWDMTIQTPRGEMSLMTKFTQDGEKITVSMVGPRGGEANGEGTIQGTAIQWSVTRTGPEGNSFTVTYKGTVEGTSMSGTAENPRGTVNWKATKK
jgi:hypothetical protein